MSAVPVEIIVTIDGLKGEWAMVVDLNEPLVAYQIGQAVHGFLLEHRPKPDPDLPTG